jgi:hypothetical protein
MTYHTAALPLLCLSLFAGTLSLSRGADNEAPPRNDTEILQSIKLPAGYEATVFARPPGVGYPTSISAAVDGVLFVAVDENGSIDTKSNRGRVLRCIDRDGDGKADEITVFATMDSPRGVIWDGPSGTGPGTLYVMHPPNLTAFHDEDGDGKADRQEDLVTGLGFDLKFRGAITPPTVADSLSMALFTLRWATTASSKRGPGWDNNSLSRGRHRPGATGWQRPRDCLARATEHLRRGGLADARSLHA